MIYYFSGTGNSKYAAEKLADGLGDKAVDIARAIKSGALPETAGEKTGFVFPVYFGGIPEIVRRFVSQPGIKNSLGGYVYCVITCGGSDSAAAFKKLENALGREVDYAASLKMPDNYVVMYDPSTKENALNVLSEANETLNGIRDDISGGKKQRKCGAMQAVMTAVMYSFYDPFRKTKKFFANDNCISCGKCELNCPDSAIQMQNGKPVWVKDKCQHCTACINRCPQAAIQFGKKTAARGRYSMWEII